MYSYQYGICQVMKRHQFSQIIQSFRILLIISVLASMYGCPAIPLVIGGAALVGVTGSGENSGKNSDDKASPTVDYATALASLKDQHPDINFNQEFSESYVFLKGKKNAWNSLVTALRSRNETILQQNEDLGEILLATKALSTYENGKILYYQHRIGISDAGNEKSKISDTIAILESKKGASHKTAISLPEAENVIRGIFFAEIYTLIHGGNLGSNDPQNQDITTEGKEENSTDLTYTLKSGETIGAISQKITGTTKNAGAILEYNRISDTKSLKAGQVLKIPSRLLQKKK